MMGKLAEGGFKLIVGDTYCCVDMGSLDRAVWLAGVELATQVYI